jgi:hypothetical protein
MQTLLQDLHFACRQLRNAPVFALTAILTLALGIGINVAMFSVGDQVLLRSMPFSGADEVVQMAVRTESGGFASTSLPDIQDWQARSHSYMNVSIPSPLASDTIGRELRRVMHDLHPDAVLNNIQTIPSMHHGNRRTAPFLQKGIEVINRL